MSTPATPDQNRKLQEVLDTMVESADQDLYEKYLEGLLTVEDVKHQMNLRWAMSQLEGN